jgi:hypothetical protein
MIAALDEIPRAAQTGDRGAVRFVIDEAERAVPSVRRRARPSACRRGKRAGSR